MWKKILKFLSKNRHYIWHNCLVPIPESALEELITTAEGLNLKDPNPNNRVIITSKKNKIIIHKKSN